MKGITVSPQEYVVVNLASHLGIQAKEVEEEWLREHHNAMAVMNVIEITSSFLHLIRRIELHDSLLHSQAKDDSHEEKLNKWYRSINKTVIPASRITLRLINKAAEEIDLHEYEDCESTFIKIEEAQEIVDKWARIANDWLEWREEGGMIGGSTKAD